MNANKKEKPEESYAECKSENYDGGFMTQYRECSICGQKTKYCWECNKEFHKGDKIQCVELPEDEDMDIDDSKYGHFCSDKCREDYFSAPLGQEAVIELIDE